MGAAKPQSVPPSYADTALARDAATRARDKRQGWWLARFAILFAIALIVGIGLLVRHDYIQSCRGPVQEMLQLKFQPGDELVDVKLNSGIDRDEYYSVRLSPASYQTVYAKVSAEIPGRETRFPAKWPWNVPADAIILEEGDGGGRSFMFSPSTRTVYLFVWTM